MTLDDIIFQPCNLS